ncbi:MAG: homocysteine S-methyltransferase family protein [Myxococcota bacterium]
MKITILDGPIGTQLIHRGHSLATPAWSAQVLIDSPTALSQLHKEYADSGASVHTTNTFRTRPESVGVAWEDLARQAVQIARQSVPHHHKIAGCIAPLEDCYHPERSPQNPGPRHAELAKVLHNEGCDLLICETFPHVPEALAAVHAACATGAETWVSFTAGPEANLLTPDEVHDGANKAVSLGATGVLINCTPATHTGHYIEAIRTCGVPFGAYANAGHTDDGVGWSPEADLDGPTRYADFAAQWIDRGATLIGACCGTGPAHIRELQRRFG